VLKADNFLFVDHTDQKDIIYTLPLFRCYNFRYSVVVTVEGICGRQSADNTTCYGCHLWPVQERFPLPVHKPGINSLYLFFTRTVSQLSSVI